jgi:hypothetical protein
MQQRFHSKATAASISDRTLSQQFEIHNCTFHKGQIFGGGAELVDLAVV